MNVQPSVEPVANEECVCAVSYQMSQTSRTIHQVIDLGEIESTITKYSKSVWAVDIPHAASNSAATIIIIIIRMLRCSRERAQSLFRITKCRRVYVSPPPPYSMPRSIYRNKNNSGRDGSAATIDRQLNRDGVFHPMRTILHAKWFTRQ